jgi:hypothetical protein
MTEQCDPWGFDGDFDPATYPGGPRLVAESFTDLMSQADDGDQAVTERVGKVCEDLLAGRVVPKDVDRIDEAVKRTQINHSLHRAIRSG